MLAAAAEGWWRSAMRLKLLGMTSLHPSGLEKRVQKVVCSRICKTAMFERCFVLRQTRMVDDVCKLR